MTTLGALAANKRPIISEVLRAFSKVRRFITTTYYVLHYKNLEIAAIRGYLPPLRLYQTQYVMFLSAAVFLGDKGEIIYFNHIYNDLHAEILNEEIKIRSDMRRISDAQRDFVTQKQDLELQVSNLQKLDSELRNHRNQIEKDDSPGLGSFGNITIILNMYIASFIHKKIAKNNNPNLLNADVSAVYRYMYCSTGVLWALVFIMGDYENYFNDYIFN